MLFLRNEIIRSPHRHLILTRCMTWLIAALVVAPWWGQSAFAQDRPDAEEADTTHRNYETAPQLIGGMDALRDEVQYPQEAKERGLEGRVVVQFVIRENGTPADVTVKRPLDPLLNAEAVRAVQNLRFLPALRGGEPVAVRMTLPISFRDN